MFKFTAKDIAIGAVVAALYAVLTVMIAPLSYGSIQFRFSEVLVLLCFYNKKFCIPLTLGCIIANMFSPFWYIDVVVGTLATLIAVIIMSKMQNIWLASLLPTITNSILVGAEVAFIYKLPIILTMLEVAVGEIVVVTAIGVPLFKYVLTKNKGFLKIIEDN